MCVATTTAITIGLGAASAASSIASSKIQSNAAKNAAKTQNAAGDRALAAQERSYQQQRADFAPYQQAGQQALGQLGSMANAPRMTFDASKPSQLGQNGPPQTASLGMPQGMPPQGPQGLPGPSQGPPQGFMGRIQQQVSGVPQSANAGMDFGQMGQAVPQQPGGGPMPWALVKVKAPTGEIAHLPRDMADRAVQQGATVVP